MRILKRTELSLVVGGMRPPANNGGVVGSGPASYGFLPSSISQAGGMLDNSNYQLPFSNLNIDVLLQNEGESSLSAFILPDNTNDAKSGAMIGESIDLSQMTKAEINNDFANILSSQQLVIADSYAADTLASQGVAPDGVDAFFHSSQVQTLTVSSQQALEMNTYEFNHTIEVVANEYQLDTNRPFSSLPESVATVAVDIGYNVGPAWQHLNYALYHDLESDLDAGNYAQLAKDILLIPNNHGRFQNDAKLINNYLSGQQGGNTSTGGSGSTLYGNGYETPGVLPPPIYWDIQPFAPWVIPPYVDGDNSGQGGTVTVGWPGGTVTVGQGAWAS